MLSKVGSTLMIFDGALGTEIQKYETNIGEVPEELNITKSDLIKKIHKSYVDAKADFISTNTFGANRFKLKGSKYSLKEIIDAAILNARSVLNEDNILMFDIGPLGKLIAPLGDLSFDDAYDAYKEIVLLAASKVDGFILETFTDLYELKAAVLAVKENCDKFLIASMSFDESKRTLTGTTPRIMVEVLEGLNVDCIGVNCSLGPIELEAIVDEILDYAHKPVIVQPNRGLPTLKDGKTSYDLGCPIYKNSMKKFIDKGISIAGGCCGTDPSFIEAIAEYKGMEINRRDNKYRTCVTSATRLVDLENVKICGERLNPTGKKKLKEAILNSDYDYLIGEAIKQEKAHADLLDVNVGLPKIDEPNTMKNVVMKLQEVIELPLQIDSSNVDAIEKGARYYNGIPLINSINAEYSVMDKILPIVKKYGCVVLGLTLDQNGVPKTAIERFSLAKRIVDYAFTNHDIDKNKIMIDTLTLTASAEQDLVMETIKALKMANDKLGVKTALGVSNVSFGLPNRELLNKTFLVMAMNNGLTMPIINPCDNEMMNAVLAYNVLSSIDKNSEIYIQNQTDFNTPVKTENVTLTLKEAIKLGLKDQVSHLTQKELDNSDPFTVINKILIPALNEIGILYEKRIIFLPQLIMSAEACKKAFSIISIKFPRHESTKGPIVLATVKGDVHDIGKNIIQIILESYGYKVIDLGKDVPIENVLSAYDKYHPKAIGLSALMTTTVVSMEKTIIELKKIKGICPIFVGGAVLTKDIALEIGADYYSKDALEFVEILEKII